MKEQDSTEAQRRALNKRFDLHEQELKRIQDETKAHVATEASLDTTDHNAVDAFNARVSELNAKADALNKQAESLTQEQRELNSRVIALNKRCAGMVVSWTDHEAVMRERTQGVNAK